MSRYPIFAMKEIVFKAPMINFYVGEDFANNPGASVNGFKILTEADLISGLFDGPAGDPGPNGDPGTIYTYPSLIDIANLQVDSTRQTITSSSTAQATAVVGPGSVKCSYAVYPNSNATGGVVKVTIQAYASLVGTSSGATNPKLLFSGSTLPPPLNTQRISCSISRDVVTSGARYLELETDGSFGMVCTGDPWGGVFSLDNPVDFAYRY